HLACRDRRADRQGVGRLLRRAARAGRPPTLRCVSFGSPLLLVTLVVVPALLLWLAVIRRRDTRNAVAFTNVDLLADVASASRPWRSAVPLALLLLALATAAAATARPRARFTSVDKHSTVVLLVDVSGSMSARDVEPTRLDAAAAAMRHFLDRVPRSALAGAARAHARGIRVDTIALGTRDGVLFEAGHYDPVPPDPQLMRAIARATGGRTFTARNAETLSGIYSHLGRTFARKTTTR